jgi:hypothetical protein
VPLADGGLTVATLAGFLGLGLLGSWLAEHERRPAVIRRDRHGRRAVRLGEDDEHQGHLIGIGVFLVLGLIGLLLMALF